MIKVELMMVGVFFIPECLMISNNVGFKTIFQGWGPRGLSSTSRTPRGQKIVALALDSTRSGLGLGLDA